MRRIPRSRSLVLGVFGAVVILAPVCWLVSFKHPSRFATKVFETDVAEGAPI